MKNVFLAATSVFMPSMMNGKKIIGGSIGCKKHKDEEHQRNAESCGYCPDLHCLMLSAAE